MHTKKEIHQLLASLRSVAGAKSPTRKDETDDVGTVELFPLARDLSAAILFSDGKCLVNDRSAKLVC